MKIVDRLVAAVSPVRALNRARARAQLAALAAASAGYEGGRSSKRRRKSRDTSTGERLVARDAATVRATMRHLERNHDLLAGALKSLTRAIIGPTGISVEPMPRIGTPGAHYDDIDDDFARDLLNLWREWTDSPEVSRTLTWVQTQELVCRTWLRDGEAFAQVIAGTRRDLAHPGPVPLALELFEADLVPLDYDQGDGVQAGIQRNAWGQPLAYYVHKTHPGNGGGYIAGDLKRVPADRILHLACRDRLSGLRGISIFAPAIDRLYDIKDYEESERIAARLAARLALQVTRDVDMAWAPMQPGAADDRDFFVEAGATFADLLPGEKLELINPNRPNSGLERFRMTQLRAASRATGQSYSSFSGDYDGTYSAQRQELVESYEAYRALTTQYVAGFVRPVWRRFVHTAIAAGAIRVPAHIRPDTIAQAEFRGPKMPWIDPLKEANALRVLSRAGIESLQQQIADRGGRLQDVFEQLARERRLAAELDLILESDAGTTSASSSATAATGGGTGDTRTDDDPAPDAPPRRRHDDDTDEDADAIGPRTRTRNGYGAH